MRRKSIQVFASDSNHNLQYQGKCKLQIDRLSSILLVDPQSEEYKIKSASFKCIFIMNKNVLFVIAEQELNDFVLIFDDEERCKKVYDMIMGDKAQNGIEKEMPMNRFLIPLCNRFTQNDDATIKLKEVVSQLFAKPEDDKEKDTITLNNASDLRYSAGSSSNVAFIESSDDTERSFIHGKRCHSQHDSIYEPHDDGGILYAYDIKFVTVVKFCRKLKSSRTYSQIVYQEQYKVIYIKPGMYIRRRLFIFTSTAKSHCYQYSWSKERKLYYCIGCNTVRHETFAISGKDENGLKCIKLEDKSHICDSIPYAPNNYVEKKIYKRHEYEILGNTASGSVLIIFDENDRSLCWEFQADKTQSLFSCCKCNASAKLVNKNAKNEYVELKIASHKCEFVPYQPKKYYHLNDIVLSPDFEIQTFSNNGQEKKRLIIFDKTDRNLCHVYCSLIRRFMCYPCRSKGIRVNASLSQTPDGEEYVVLSKVKHICKLRSYSDLSKKEIILRPPDFELMDNTRNGTKKLFIFDLNDRSLCYTFSFNLRTRQKYYCQGCNTLQRRHKANLVKRITATLCKDENGDYYVRLNDSKHACAPRKYDPEKYAIKEYQKCYDFFFFRRQTMQGSVNVAIYHPEDKTLCCHLNFNQSLSRFQCSGCITKKRHAFYTIIKKDEYGREYFNHDYKKHVCEPIKVSSICAPEFVMLARNEINFEEKKKPQINESKIIKPPNFELLPNQKGVPDASLLIYHCEDRSVGHRYTYRNDRKYYLCYKAHICSASAKLQIQENGEMCIVLGKGQHRCEPVNFMKT